MANRLLLLIVPFALMIAVLIGLTEFEQTLASLGKSDAQRLMFWRAGIALPYLAASGIGIVFLFAAAGAISAIGVAAARLSGSAGTPAAGPSVLTLVEPAVMIGGCIMLIAGGFALRVALKGNAVFAASEPKRVRGRRALHGDAGWMSMQEAAKHFPDHGGIVVGERYRVDKDSVAAMPFRAGDRQSWGAGGKAPLLCFDTTFGSSHGIVFAGSGGFKTTSVTIPTALKWGGTRAVRDDFFRASALQLLTALIADVCLSGHTEEKDQTMRQVRANLSEPEPTLKKRLQTIYDQSKSQFVKENVAAFVNMTPETFSGVYANAVKETHWLSYANYAALVSGTRFVIDDLADGKTDVFINLDLKTLETHAGLARVIIGAFMNAIYNRNGKVEGRALFLLDEVARLGFMRILETARDAGRKYGITLLLLFQSIGQMRETYGGRDAASKWFERASWISFAAVNDPETADYISKRCGTTTVEIDQLSRSSQASGSSRTRSKQLASRPLIQPHEVLCMRTGEQIVFTAGNPPLRCGRAIWFRRDDMKACVKASRFHRDARTSVT